MLSEKVADKIVDHKARESDKLNRKEPYVNLAMQAGQLKGANAR